MDRLHFMYYNLVRAKLADAACNGSWRSKSPWETADIVNLTEDDKAVLRKERMERAKERREPSYNPFA